MKGDFGDRLRAGKVFRRVRHGRKRLGRHGGADAGERLHYGDGDERNPSGSGARWPRSGLPAAPSIGPQANATPSMTLPSGTYADMMTSADTYG